MDKSQIKIMVLDDEEGIVFFIKTILQRKNYVNVFATTLAEEALEHYSKDPAEICILDVFLGNTSKIDGIKVLEEVKKMNPNAVCLMVSRASEEAIVNRAMELGAEKYCKKPIELKDFIQVLEECVTKVLDGK